MDSLSMAENEDDMDSLFEGMVLFTTPTPADDAIPSTSVSALNSDHHCQSSQLEEGEEAHHPHHQKNNSLPSDSTSSTSAATPVPASVPLDENLFADLNLIGDKLPEEEEEEEEVKEDRNHGHPRRLISSSSRKKKRAAGLRIGYGRDVRADQHLDHDDQTQLPDTKLEDSIPIENEIDGAEQNQHQPPSQEEEEEVAEAEAEAEAASSLQSQDEEAKPSTTGTIEMRFEEIKGQIAQKLNAARQAISSVSAARKDAIKNRRKAAQLLSAASSKYIQLEKELEDAIETEDFEKAERLGDTLASADKHREVLLVALKDAESRCDDLESQMRVALESQIEVEEASASLLLQFSKDASINADLVLENAEALFSREMEKWTSSTEEVELKKLQLEIESHLMNEARSAIHDSIVHSTEDDQRERDILYKRREILAEELQKLYALVKLKEAEIVENDCKIETVESRIAGVVANFDEANSGLDEKYNILKSGLCQLDSEHHTLSQRKKQIDDDLSLEETRVTKVREISKISADEANVSREVVGLRKSLMQFALKFMENKMSLSKAEQQLTEDVSALRLDISAARTSLQELSSSKSSIQKELESLKQRLIFIDKRVPELEAEKKVAATARNFKEAARIATEAKALLTEKEGLGIKTEDAILQLQKLEEQIGNIVNKLEETEAQVLSKTKELEMARFHRLILVAEAAKAERSAALELGDVEEADALSAEADAAAAEASRLKLLYGYEDEDLSNQTGQFVPLELVSKLGVKQLAGLVTTSVDD
ncbi:OLC1v1016226C1 [Oldenlandia corymbosa var. corymbosa]|uniref:OLC1v1016226C1 n=1 Tax=Oldenlandia corymbosa var. corymbosa TaxID=529605 RepID=A0AAV1E4X3_OLDCO|nr:OLC1v1016226C1 [Oldenlandia corymbosa var. corymbosa]